MSSSIDRLFRALIRINDIVLAPTDPDHSLVAVAREVIDACDADGCQFLIGGDDELGSIDVLRDGAVREHFALPHPDCAVLSESTPTARCRTASFCPGIAPQHWGAAVCASLGVADDQIGVVRVWRRHEAPFGDGEMQLIASVGSRIGAAIRRRRLVEQLRRANETLEAGVEARTRQLAELNLELTRQKEAAEAASQAKTQFLANMSHEIRTPMNGIMGMAELLSHTQLDREQRGHLETLMNCAQSLLDVLNDILDVSRIEAGRVELERIPFDPREVVESVGAVLATRAAERGLELVCRVAGAVPSLIIGDPGRLRQIITNLATNAIKFTRRGEVDIIAGTDPDGPDRVRLWVEVRDTGIGIPEEKLSSLFEKFTQADGSTSRRHGGSGLGLAICKDLVQLMGGFIDVESKVGVGTTFWFSIPAEVVRDSPVARPEVDLTGCSVLLADDHATTRAAISSMLRELGCHVQAASRGEDAVAAVSNHDFDVVLVDASMSELDGFETSARIRAIPRASDVEILILTSGARRRDQSRAKELGISGFLQKPVRRHVLASALARATSRSLPDSGRGSLRNDVDSRATRPGARLLVVEDNDVNRTFMTSLLERAGYHVQAAASGEEAIEAATRTHFDVVLMDLQMPGMDGLQTTAAIRQLSSAANTSIVAVTAHAMRSDEERCHAAGMEAYVSKPVNPRRLFAVIESCLTTPRGWRSSVLPDVRASRSVSVDAASALDLSGLAADTGWDFAVAHVARYLQRAEEWMQRLVEAVSAGDTDTAARVAHQIRGGAVHMKSVASAATDAMCAARAGDLPALSTATKQLDLALSSAREEFERQVRTEGLPARPPDPS